MARGTRRLVWWAGEIGYSDIEVPTYAYRCESHHEFEVVQPISAPALATCPTCGTAVRRVVFPVGVVFKGQGFYKTDSRSSSTGSINPPSGTAAASATETKSATESKASPAPGGATAGATGTGEKNA